MKQELTEKQQAVFGFIEKYQLKNGKSPTLREMREFLGVSSDNSVLKHLTALKEKGWIKKDDTPRGIKLLGAVRDRLDAAANVVKLPVLGTVPAGGAILSEENVLDELEVSATFVKKPNDSFILRVSGESMLDAGIHDGDLAIATRGIEPRDGDIVIALVDGDSTVKTFKKGKGKPYLQAENSEYNDIYPVEAMTVQGIVTGLIRKY